MLIAATRCTQAHRENAVLEGQALLTRLAHLREPGSPVADAHRPLIGVPAFLTGNMAGKGLLQAVSAALVRALIEAGADPYVCPCRPLSSQEDPFLAVWHVLRRCDGLLLADTLIGHESQNVSAGWCTQTLHPLTSAPRWWEDWWKLHLAKLATLLRLPLLGIGQGMAYWVVALGGTLIEHVSPASKQPGSFEQHFAWNQWRFHIQQLSAERQSWLGACAVGQTEIWGACRHQQAVETVPAGLRVTAREKDGLIAAVEREDGCFGVGILWHPEQREIYATQPYARRLFALFVSEARHSLRQCSEIEDLREQVRAYLPMSIECCSHHSAHHPVPPLILADTPLTQQETVPLPARPAARMARTRATCEQAVHTEQ